MAPHCPEPLLTVPSEVGKTGATTEDSELLDQGVAHTLVDTDSLRWHYPRPPLCTNWRCCSGGTGWRTLTSSRKPSPSACT